MQQFQQMHEVAVFNLQGHMCVYTWMLHFRAHTHMQEASHVHWSSYTTSQGVWVHYECEDTHMYIGMEHHYISTHWVISTYLMKCLQTVTTLTSLLPENSAFWRPFWRSMMSIFVPRSVYNIIRNTCTNKNERQQWLCNRRSSFVTSMCYSHNVHYNASTWKMAAKMHRFQVNGSLASWRFGDALQGKYTPKLRRI